jgi:hypothetical protein
MSSPNSTDLPSATTGADASRAGTQSLWFRRWGDRM